MARGSAEREISQLISSYFTWMDNRHTHFNAIRQSARSPKAIINVIGNPNACRQLDARPVRRILGKAQIKEIARSSGDEGKEKLATVSMKHYHRQTPGCRGAGQWGR